MNLKLSCPSKTFLLGEYLVLNQGAALVLNTLPRFELNVNTRGEGSVQGVSPDSPAGQWMRQNKLVFSSVDVDFIDPHFGRGGFGASSAQYMLTNIVTQVLKNPEKHEDFNIESIWRAYRQMEMVSTEGLKPSGADIVSQYAGGLCEVMTDPFQFKSYKWPFADYSALLVHTGVKLATHEHLRGLKRLDTDELESIYARAMEMMSIGDAPAFFDSVNDYYAELLEMSLVAEQTQVAVATLLSKPFIRAAKGCGAMGSDVIAVFIANQNRELALNLIAELNLKLIADSDTLERGFEITMDDKSGVKKYTPKEDLT
jgi:mevalonate kinase